MKKVADATKVTKNVEREREAIQAKWSGGDKRAEGHFDPEFLLRSCQKIRCHVIFTKSSRNLASIPHIHWRIEGVSAAPLHPAG